MSDLDHVANQEFAVYQDGDELVAIGDQQAVSEYIEAVRSITGQAVSIANSHKSETADLAALLSSVAGIAANTNDGTYFRVAHESRKLLEENGLMPGAHSGLFRGIATSDKGKIAGLVQFEKSTMTPAAVVSVQMTMAMVALRVAINDVAVAVDAIDGKVETLLAHASADKSGNVIGQHAAVTHLSAMLDEDGVLTRTDWESIASMGPQLQVTLAKLRKYVDHALAQVECSGSVADRRDALRKLRKDFRIGDTLQLVVVAEDALFHWQRLRLAQTRNADSENVEFAVRSARKLVEDNVRMDGEVYAAGVHLLETASKVSALDGARLLSLPSLKKEAELLRSELDSFANARRVQVWNWTENPSPTIRDAALEMGRIVRSASVGALGRSRNEIENLRTASESLRTAGTDVIDRGISEIGATGERLQEFAARHAEKQYAERPRRSGRHRAIDASEHDERKRFKRDD